MFFSLMIDLAEVQEEQKVDEVICVSSSPSTLKYNVKACFLFSYSEIFGAYKRISICDLLE